MKTQTTQEIKRVEIPAFRIVIKDILEGKFDTQTNARLERTRYQERIVSMENATAIAKELERKGNWNYLPERYTGKLFDATANYDLPIVNRRCIVEPHNFIGLSVPLPKKGDLLYVPGSDEFDYGNCAYLPPAQKGIKGGLAEVEVVNEEYAGLDDCYEDNPEFEGWRVNFAELGLSNGHDLETLLKMQPELKIKYKHHNAEPIYDKWKIEMEIIHDAMEGEWR